MSTPERVTQNRIIQLFHEELCNRYLGDWKDRAGNSNIEEAILTSTLQRCGYSSAEISGALFQLRTAADISQVGLYEANRKVYSLLRYGVQVKAAADQPTSTVALIDWHTPEANASMPLPAVCLGSCIHAHFAELGGLEVDLPERSSSPAAAECEPR